MLRSHCWARAFSYVFIIAQARAPSPLLLLSLVLRGCRSWRPTDGGGGWASPSIATAIILFQAGPSVNRLSPPFLSLSLFGVNWVLEDLTDDSSSSFNNLFESLACYVYVASSSSRAINGL